MPYSPEMLWCFPAHLTKLPVFNDAPPELFGLTGAFKCGDQIGTGITFLSRMHACLKGAFKCGDQIGTGITFLSRMHACLKGAFKWGDQIGTGITFLSRMHACLKGAFKWGDQIGTGITFLSRMHACLKGAFKWGDQIGTGITFLSRMHACLKGASSGAIKITTISQRFRDVMLFCDFLAFQIRQSARHPQQAMITAHRNPQLGARHV